MSKKVLIVCYYWPPSGGSGVQRWLKFVKYLPQFGWEPIIYTVQNGEFPVVDNSLLNEIPKNIIVIKKPIWEPFNLYKKFIGKKKNEKFGHGFADDKKNNFFVKCLQNFAFWVRGNFFIPDARKYFVNPSIKFLETYLNENNIEHIITTGPPHSMHLIGLGLKKKMNIKWIADFRDPWSGVYYFKDLKLSTSSLKKHIELEKAVLLGADKIVAVGKSLLENLSRLVEKEKIKNRFSVITNGYDPKLNDELLSTENNKEFSIVYTGLFSKDQNHECLWQAIGELAIENPDFKNNLKIYCYGKTDVAIFSSITENKLGNNFFKKDYVSLAEVGKIQQDACILLLCINHYPGENEMLTGKLFDYIFSGRPILNIGPIVGDAAKIISETKTGQTFSRLDKAGIKQHLKESFDKFKEGSLSITPINLEKFTRKELTKELANLLNEV